MDFWLNVSQSTVEFIRNEHKFKVKFRKFENLKHALVFLLYEGDYEWMDADGVSVPRPQSQSPKKHSACERIPSNILKWVLIVFRL